MSDNKSNTTHSRKKVVTFYRLNKSERELLLKRYVEDIPNYHDEDSSYTPKNNDQENVRKRNLMLAALATICVLIGGIFGIALGHMLFSDNEKNDTSTVSIVTTAESDNITISDDISLVTSEQNADTASIAAKKDYPIGDAPEFAPEGAYYNWAEVAAIFENYLKTNKMTGSYGYQSGIDGVEMVFEYYEDDGETALFRVDLVTGIVTPI